MPNAFKPLTITMPRPFLARVKREAEKRQTSVSELLRDSFIFYADFKPDIYTDTELKKLLNRDKLPSKLKDDLDKLFA